MRIFWLLFGIISLYPSNVEARSMRDHVGLTLGCRGNPCIVRRNYGGMIMRYEWAAHQIRAGRRRVIIDGRCYSACTIFADLARAKVCVTKRAMFLFHKAGVYVSVGSKQKIFTHRSDPPQSGDIRAWVLQRGGYPKDGYLRMNSIQALRFWKRC